MKLAGAVAVICFFLTTVIFADEPPDSAKTTDSLIQVTIGKISVSDGHLYDTLQVSLQNLSHEIGGFDLKIGWLSDMFDIVKVIKGDVYDSCNWEFFNDRQSQLPLDPESINLLQIVGLADMSGDTTQPKCFTFPEKISLCRLIVAGRGLGALPDTAIPLFFFWEDCSDNTISGKSGNKLFLSQQVTDVISGKPDLSKDRFPTENGTPKECIKGVSKNPPHRVVTFTNGGIEILFKLDTLNTSK